MTTMEFRGRSMIAFFAAAAFCLCLASLGTAGPQQVAPALADTLPAVSGFAFDCAIHGLTEGDVDSFVVVANARNVSNAPVALCCRFDFEGAFTPAATCREERPPIFFLLARASAPETRLDCRATVLAPGAAYSDSASFQLYRPSFTVCPGTIEIRGSFWVGRPGESFAGAKLLVQDAVRVSTPEPAAP